MSTSIEDVDQQLHDAILRSRQVTKLQRDRDALAKRVTLHRADVKELERAHAAEVDDVEQLTSTSLRKLVALIRGDIEERLSTEEAEAARAATELAHARDLLATEEARLTAVRRELTDLGDPGAEIERLRGQKQELVDADSDLGRELAELHEREARAAADLREVDEAIAAGQQSLAALGQAGALLRSARNWSTWDVMGGGMIVTMQKHDRLDDARRAGTAAAAALARFADELDDVHEDVATAPTVDLSEWDVAFDFFFDNFFTDIRIDGMIRRSQEQTARVDRRVRTIVDDLHRLRTAVAEEAAALEERRHLLLDPPVW